MNIKRGKNENRQLVLHIEADEDLVQSHLNRAHKKVSGRVNIPGFRKGKAPRSVVERFVGREYLLEEALETLAPDLVSQAVEIEELQISATPSISVKERDPIVKIDATIPLSPEVNLGEYSNIHFKDKAKPVTKTDIDESIEQLRNSQAKWDPVDRPVENGDLVIVNAIGLANGKQFVDMDGTEYLADSENQNPVPGFSDALLGIEPGQAKKFTLDIPDGFRDEEIAGSSGEFEVTVTSLREKILPELTDDLVKNLEEDMNTVAELRARIKKVLQLRSKATLRESLENKVLEAVVEMSTFDLPPLLVDQQAEHIIHDQQNTLRQYNINFEQYMQSSGKTTEDLFSDARQAAETRLKRTLVIDRLAEAEDISISEEEVNEELVELNSQRQTSGQPALESDDQQTKGSVEQILRRRKAIDRMIELTAITPKKKNSKETKPTKKRSKSRKIKEESSKTS